MKRVLLLVVAAATVAGVVAAQAQTSTRSDVQAAPQSAKEVRGATPYAAIANEPPPKLIVDAPLTNLLDKGVVWIQYRTENVRIIPVFGKEALDVPASGPPARPRRRPARLWADASDINTIDVARLPPGPHKIRIDLVNANHEVFPGQAKTVTFTIPAPAK